MKKLSISIREKASKLRRLGYSIEEIAIRLNIAKSTSSIWVRGVNLDKKALDRIESRKLLGYRKAALHWSEKLRKKENNNSCLAQRVVSNISRDLNHGKLYCALLYWCEGGKGEKEGLKFSNSDPALIKTFLKLFRSCFSIKNEKIRLLMHLHNYHDEQKQKIFWSKITGIPKRHFYKTFIKASSKIRIKKNYPGCITIYYNDRSIAREIRAIYKVFSK